MRKTAAVFISIGVILVIAGLIMVGIFGGSALKDFKWSNIVNVLSHDLTRANEEKSISDVDFTQIKIDVDRYSVYVLPNEGNEVTVKYVSPLEGDADLNVSCNNGVLSITETDSLKSSWFGSVFKTNRFIAVYVPQAIVDDVAFAINAKTAGISVKDLAMTSISCFAQTGGIEIKNVQADSVNVETNTGALSVENVNCQALTGKTNTGAINVENSVIDGKADISAHTGAVNFDSAAQTLVISTNTGSVNFRTSSSNISVCADTGSVSGTVLGNEKEYQITVKKDTGSSNIKNQTVENAEKFLNVEVDTGSINIKFGN